MAQVFPLLVLVTFELLLIFQGFGGSRVAALSQPKVSQNRLKVTLDSISEPFLSHL